MTNSVLSSSGLIVSILSSSGSVVSILSTSISTSLSSSHSSNSDVRTLSYICDTTFAKQGKFSPGAHIPVFSHEKFYSNFPDYTILFAFNHKKEILKKEKSYIEQGGKWIEYIPRIKIS